VRRGAHEQPHPAKLTRPGTAMPSAITRRHARDRHGGRPDRSSAAMIDFVGTPYTEKLHVVERYRWLDYDDAKNAMQRGTKENRRRRDRITQYKDKYLQVHFTIEDEGAFTTPWPRS